jgi:hypothetical protein
MFTAYVELQAYYPVMDVNQSAVSEGYSLADLVIPAAQSPSNSKQTP